MTSPATPSPALGDPSTPSRRDAPARHAAPMGATLGFTLLNSLGTGIVTNGVFFLAKEAYAFDRVENYALGVLLGGTYVAGALAVGPALQRLIQRIGWITHRLALATIMLALAVVCILPWSAAGFTDSPGAGGTWAIWALVAAFGPLTGALWPIVESYVSGGRRGPELRRAIGTWNITWSAAVAASMWLIAPLVAPAPRLVIAGLGVVCLAALAFLPAMGRDPGRHLAENGPEVPPDYERHLRVFRILLPASYFILSALGPNLPTALERLGVAPGWRTPLGAAWMLVRVPAFLILAGWHGWHGRWWMATGGAGLMAAGFALAVAAPAVLSGPAATLGVVLTVLGLSILGVGMAMIYVGALYYVSAARHGAVGAGGSHEALIGVGYVGGPVCGLIAAGTAPQAWFEPGILAFVGVVIVVTGVMAWRAARPDAPGAKGPG